MKLSIPTLIVLLLVTGCVYTTYDVELSPEDQQLRRVVTEKFRDTQNPERNQDILLTDALCTIMPEDLDNAGQYIRYESSMGTAQLYVEQFRGNDQPGSVIEAGFDKIDEGVDDLIARIPEWRTHMETQGCPPEVLVEFTKIEPFLDTTLRQDLKDLYIYSYLAANAPHPTWLGPKDDDEPIDDHGRMTLDMGVRMGQLLLRKDYLTAETIPLWGRLFAENMEFGTDSGQELFAGILERKAGVVNAREVTAALIDAIESSDITGNETTEEETVASDPIDGNDEEPIGGNYEDGVSAIFQEIFGDIFLLSDPSDTLNATLATPVRPLFTNGFWDDDEGVLRWERPIPKEVGDATSILPAVCYAAWVEPTDTFQKDHFGKVILTDGDLYLYCLWKAGLTEDEQAQWDTAIDQCTPGSLDPLEDVASADLDYTKHGLDMIHKALGIEDDESE
jgi:hypothetical protein